MNTTMMQNTAKSSKTYQLAIEFSQYSGQQNIPQKKITIPTSNTYRLPKIIDVDEEDKTTRKKSPFKNIFNTENQDHMKTDELANEKSFNIVGKKQVKSYLHKLVKKKNILQRRNQSALSLSRYSSSVKSQNENSLYLNKQDVLSFLRPSPNQTQNQSKILREDQMMTMGTHKTTMSQKFEITSLRKSKDVFETYNKTWDKEKMKKVKFPSILDHISNYRSKVQLMQNNALNEKRLHTKDVVWIETLRGQKNVDNFYNDKYVQKVLKDSQKFVLKGRDKLHKQMQWIDEKDKSGYTFAFLDNLAIKPGKFNRDQKTISKEEKLGQSSVNRVVMRDSSSYMQKSKDSETASKVGIMNSSTSNMKNILRSSKITPFSSQIKQLNHPPILSQFSATGTTFLSPIKNRPNTIGVSQGRDDQGINEQKRVVRIR